jgi:hypothetical protein
VLQEIGWFKEANLLVFQMRMSQRQGPPLHLAINSPKQANPTASEHHYRGSAATSQ